MQKILENSQKLAEQGKFSEAIDELGKLGNVEVDKPAVRYIKAVCLRNLSRFPAALVEIRKVIQAQPDHARAYQELGHIHVVQKNADEAVRAYTEAVNRDPALLSSWQPLVGLYKILRNSQAMEIATQQVEALSKLPPALLAVKSFLNEGNLEMADTVCRHFLSNNKQHVEGLRLLAEVAMQAQILDDAEFILESAVAFEPKNIGARFDLATTRLKRQKFALAHEVVQELCIEQPANNEFKTILGAARLGIGETEDAIKIYHELIEEGHQLKSSYLLLGHAQKTAGDIDAAVEAYQNLYKHQADFGDAFWSLANTKTYKFSDAEVAHMQDYEQRASTSLEDRVHMCFALGKAFEDRSEYQQAFRYYEQGNRLNQQRMKHSAPDIERRTKRQMEVCTAELFESRKDLGLQASDPIFIVGLPRAGSTLLEQILASHSQVDGTLELPNILSLSRRLRGRAAPKPGEEPKYPAILQTLDEAYFERFGQQYIDDTRVFREQAPMFIDKMPNNFLHLGLIKLILPNAKVVDARRHPMSCCFSGFKQLFAEGQEFTYGLKEIGTYYKSYVDMMNHWDKVLPGFVLRVQHEDVVHDLETQVRRILDFCGLPFEEACLEFYNTKRNVRTPSSEQVRQPIYTSGLDVWKNYESWLEPLKEALGPEICKHYEIV